MGAMSWVHWLLVIGVAALLFGGGGKLSSLMGDAAKGIRAFRDGLKGDESAKAADTTTAPLPKADKDEARH